MTFTARTDLVSRRTAARITGIILLAAFATGANAGFENCLEFFPNGYQPKVAASAPSVQRDVCFDSFAVLYSGESKTPIYVVERLNRRAIAEARDGRRTNRFYEEARLPSADRSTLRDYKSELPDGRRFDRGHMAPAGDMWNSEGMAQSFSLANMVPQAPMNNRRKWAGIEKATRKYVMRAAGDVYVFTGPVFEQPVEKLGPNRVWVPKYLFKLVYDATTGRSWAHWIENTDDARVQPPIAYEELVRRTGIRFLSDGKSNKVAEPLSHRLRQILESPETGRHGSPH